MSNEIEIGRFCSMPLKKSQDVDIIKPMEAYISKTYDKNVDGLTERINEFHNLRKNAIKQIEKSTTSLNVLFRYYDQLVAVTSKVPFKKESGVQIAFVWKDSLQKGTLINGPPKMSISDGDFERLCILYNIAALMSQLAVKNEESLQTDTGRQAAAKYFQESAGILAYINDNVSSIPAGEVMTMDMTSEALTTFESVMVAQAQECIYDKACADSALQKKPEIIAKIANRASLLYGEIVNSDNNSVEMSPVIQLCRAKQDLFRCQAEMHQARAACEEKRYGESVARYTMLESTMKPMLTSPYAGCISGERNIKQLYSIVVSEKQSVEKDNAFCGDVVPRESELSPIGTAVLAKTKVYNPDANMSLNFQDLFHALVPLNQRSEDQDSAIQGSSHFRQTQKGSKACVVL